MDWLVFKSNITTQNQVQQLSLVLNQHEHIISWSVDLEDCDKVFRILPENGFEELEARDLLNIHGYLIEPLEN